ncbi:MAG: isoaspartyl peptidase/L-asparaginase [Pseudomonadota bacterium]
MGSDMLKHVYTAAFILILGACASVSIETDFASDSERPEWSMAIHGGAGVITRDRLTPEQDAAYRASLERALQAGADILSAGGSSLDAVEAAVVIMEDDPLYNAGQGAVMTAAATHELDASVMVGDGRNAGAVAGVTATKNPIKLARAVMEESEHVMFSGPGADVFSVDHGLEQVENGYFTTERRRSALQRVLESRARTDADRHGTVGAVALDRAGNLAAATSTGGMTAKAAGRVGDSPLIGAATYAENGVFAVSATGHGEYFIRVGVAKTICSRVELAGESITAASEAALDQVAALGGDGGVIVMGGGGEVAFVFNSAGMYRGRMAEGSDIEIAIYGPGD